MRVQTEGDKDGNDQLIGLASNDAGFLDSPDVEWISGGVSSKGPQAVAIGRHGHFFLWGFAASQTYLSDEAKLVLLNPLHYIAKFDGAAIVARFTQGLAEVEEFKKVMRQRIKDGEDVSERERASLGRPAPEAPDRLDPFRHYLSSEELESLGGDPAKVAKYLRVNLRYFHPTGPYQLGVDPELRRLGFANDDLSMVVRAVKMLNAGSDGNIEIDIALARTLLERYTNQSFAKLQQWNEWLRANRSTLFFSESAGYKWLVNPYRSLKGLNGDCGR
ncbi:MAG: hypothetical protein V3W41_18575 [Planctomycetota bacterium]